MINVNGHKFSALTDPIYVNGKRVRRVYANGELVYPTRDPGDDGGDDGGYDSGNIAIYFKLDRSVFTNYSDTPVNMMGGYAIVNGPAIHKVAFLVSGTSEPYYHEQLFLTFNNYQSGGSITYVPFVAKDDEILADGKSSSSIYTFTLEPVLAEGNKYYYRSPYIAVNFQTKYFPQYLSDYVIDISTKGSKLFVYNTQDAIDYVLS